MRQKFKRRLKQFIIEFEDNQNEDFIVQFFKKLNIDIDISIDNISINEFVIKFNNESKSFLIAVDSVDDSKTIIAIIIMLVDKTFKHKLISMNNIIVFTNSIFYIYNVFIVLRYDDCEFKNILIDHDAADFSSENIEQFTTLQRISKTTLTLNKKNHLFQFRHRWNSFNRHNECEHLRWCHHISHRIRKHFHSCYVSLIWIACVFISIIWSICLLKNNQSINFFLEKNFILLIRIK